MSRTPIDSLRERLEAHRAQGGNRPRFRAAPEGSVPVSAPVESRRRERPHRPGPLARLVDMWWSRLLASLGEGSLSDQDAEYDDGMPVRDYIWNTVGTSVWGCVFPALTVVATQLAGAEGAGMFSMAFVVGTLIMIAASYGVRTFQVSDLEETHSFASYQVNRWITGALALLAGGLYCSLRSYDGTMTTICMGVFVYKAVDGIADVYEGRLQQADKLYLAGISQAVRSVAAIVSFSALLFVSRSLPVASVAMAVAAVASFVLLTAPLALLETDKSRPAAIGEVLGLLGQCLPLAAALFLFNLIESMPKFAMEGSLAYENQLYFNALYFPAQGILLASGFIYKPQLVRLASIWANPRRRRTFSLIVAAMLAVVVGITVVSGAFMRLIGLELMSFMYGMDFERFAGLALLMVIAGGVTAGIEFLYAIVTVLRRQHEIIRLYLIAFAASAILPHPLVWLFGLTGAVVSYLAVMSLLLGLLLWRYVHMRRDIARALDPFA